MWRRYYVNEDHRDQRKENVLTEQPGQEGFFVITQLIKMLWSDVECYAKHDQGEAYIKDSQASG
jgi:hypothetical protein